MLWITVPSGMFASGSALPILMSAFGARLDDVADLEPDRREDVALLAVAVVQQRDAGGAVGIVLDRRDLGRNRILGALEVDDAVLLARAAAFVARRDVAVVVAAGMLLLDLEQRLLGLLLA